MGKESYKVLKFHRSNSSYFKISASLLISAAFQWAEHPKASKINMFRDAYYRKYGIQVLLSKAKEMKNKNYFADAMSWSKEALV